MIAASSSAQQPAARHGDQPLHGLAALWWRCTMIFRGNGAAQDAGARRPGAFTLWVFAAIALLGVFCGLVVAVVDLNGVYLCVALIGCAFILRDFRIGVVLLILLMPISSSRFFPHAMLGITGLNPLNLLLVGTLGSSLFRKLLDRRLSWLLTRPLLVPY